MSEWRVSGSSDRTPYGRRGWAESDAARRRFRGASERGVVRLIEREVLIVNRAGIHARPAAKLVQTASAFRSDIFLESGGERVNGKSIMGIITLGATYRTTVRIIADGSDERAAVGALEALFARRFEDTEA